MVIIHIIFIFVRDVLLNGLNENASNGISKESLAYLLGFETARNRSAV